MTTETNTTTNPLPAAIHRDTSHIEKKVISNMEFISIGDEQWRQYDLMTSDGIIVYQIDDPAWLFVRPSGAHMVLDGEGTMHYIKQDFVALRWNNGDNTPANF